jgi:hypothetical protein
MICKPCKKAADKGLQGAEEHKGCTGCECMHREGPKESLLNLDRIAKGREPYVPIVPNNG